MAKREYSIFTSSRGNKVFKFVVTDAYDLDEANSGHPHVAEFHVSRRHTEDEQRERAKVFTDYMNRIVEATRIAHEQTQLIDLIKR